MSRDFTIRRLCTRRDVNQVHAFLLTLQWRGCSSLNWVAYPDELRAYLMEYRSGRRSRVLIARCARHMRVNDDGDVMTAKTIAGVMVAHRPLQLNRGLPVVSYWSASDPRVVTYHDAVHESLYDYLIRVSDPLRSWGASRRVQMGRLELI